MKTRNFLLTAMALFVAVTVSATKIPTLNVVPVEKSKALIAFESPKAADVELTLKDKAGDVLYYKKSEMPVEELRMVFNFNDLKDGIYDVALAVNNCKIHREITVSGRSLTAVGAQKREYSPVCYLDNDLLKVSYLNSDLKNVHLNIYRDGHYIAGKKLGKDMCIQKALDFSKLESGEYEIVLTGNTEDYLFTVNK